MMGWKGMIKTSPKRPVEIPTFAHAEKERGLTVC
jgi:hypothetical protein